ncbi:CBS domain-containing protein [Tumebacillus algifaecis]|uniref:CBS domain-containing protein n=1 Tax=Tumebacillus algifaecis TaxID=1214604 RepID=A0A223CYU2_9BACL|nr:CBS domain-containing protein [Tumebacillus algifaecis]ASS74540.1 CBS domain-containing protein [Tumebacillus algifaecis]
MKICDLMTKEVITLKPIHTLQEAAKLMCDLNVGVIPIAEEGDKLRGLITDRDIVVRAVAKGVDIKSAKINDYMSPKLVSINPSETAQEAAKLMAEHQIRRLPVVKEGHMVGIVSIGDLSVVGIHENEAGFALSEISTPSQPQL